MNMPYVEMNKTPFKVNKAYVKVNKAYVEMNKTPFKVNKTAFKINMPTANILSTRLLSVGEAQKKHPENSECFYKIYFLIED